VNRQLACVTWVFALGACATVPTALQPPAAERLVARWQVEGQWVWHCRLANDGKTQAWALLRPEARLKDERGQEAGRLEQGPDIVLRDGSRAEASVAAQHDAGPALAWQLWRLRSAGAPGALATATSAQLLNTQGGGAPADGCSSGDHLMAERAVPVTAQLNLFSR
jgi:hypothetical protein